MDLQWTGLHHGTDRKKQETILQKINTVSKATNISGKLLGKLQGKLVHTAPGISD